MSMRKALLIATSVVFVVGNAFADDSPGLGTELTAEQLAVLEKQYLERKCLEGRGLPRLSLFYL